MAWATSEGNLRPGCENIGPKLDPQLLGIDLVDFFVVVVVALVFSFVWFCLFAFFLRQNLTM